MNGKVLSEYWLRVTGCKVIKRNPKNAIFIGNHMYRLHDIAVSSALYRTQEYSHRSTVSPCTQRHPSQSSGTRTRLTYIFRAIVSSLLYKKPTLLSAKALALFIHSSATNCIDGMTVAICIRTFFPLTDFRDRGKALSLRTF